MRGKGEPGAIAAFLGERGERGDSYLAYPRDSFKSIRNLLRKLLFPALFHYIIWNATLPTAFISNCRCYHFVWQLKPNGKLG